ncbi:MAG: formylglycine-generating enzyme family protein [Acidobacteria bacterium]|nr:formylglycine-generating enzyme family protein [Acidobacteriota bacterium]
MKSGGCELVRGRPICALGGVVLPTEQQWEKAASWDEAAGVAREYPWGAWDERAPWSAATSTRTEPGVRRQYAGTRTARAPVAVSIWLGKCGSGRTARTAKAAYTWCYSGAVGPTLSAAGAVSLS